MYRRSLGPEAAAMDLATREAEGSPELGPMVFFCSACRNIISDSTLFLSSHQEDNIISVKGKYTVMMHDSHKSSAMVACCCLMQKAFRVLSPLCQFIRYHMTSMQASAMSNPLRAQMAVSGGTLSFYLKPAIQSQPAI